MQNLIDFIIKYKYWFTFFIMESVCLAILIRFNNYQGSVYFTTANSMVGGIYNAADGVTSYVSLGKVNEQLEADNVALREEVEMLRNALESKRMTIPDINANPTQRYQYIGAQIINATTNRSNNLLTLNKGAADGVRPEMGVVCSSGVIGIVYLTSEHYSIVMPLVNVKSKISCRLHEHSSFGTIEWKFGDIRYAYMTGVPLHITVGNNETIETNGFSDIFPPGIPVGTVEETEPSADGLSHLLRVKLAVDFASVRNVSIITNYKHTEKARLEYEADSIMNH